LDATHEPGDVAQAPVKTLTVDDGLEPVAPLLMAVAEMVQALAGMKQRTASTTVPLGAVQPVPVSVKSSLVAVNPGLLYGGGTVVDESRDVPASHVSVWAQTTCGTSS